MNERDDIAAAAGMSDEQVEQIMTRFRAGLDRLIADPDEAARVQVLADAADHDLAPAGAGQDRHEDEEAAGGIGVSGSSGQAAGGASASGHPGPVRDVAIDEGPAAPRLFTISETARRMRVSKKTVNRLIGSGELETVRRGWSLRVPEHAIQAYEKDHPGRPGKMTTGEKVLLGGAALAGAGIVAYLASRDRRLTERDEIKNAVEAPVLASLPALHPASPEEWRNVLDGYRHAPAQAWQLHEALQELGVIDRPAGGGSIAVFTLSADPGALALGPQLAVYAALLGIKTALVIGPGPDTKAMAALRAACAEPSVGQPGYLRTVSHKAIEDTRQESAADELTILVAEVEADARPVLEVIRVTTSIVIGVSAGAATKAQLAQVAMVGEDRTVAGVLIANPTPTDRGTRPVPDPAGDSGHMQPNLMSDISSGVPCWA